MKFENILRINRQFIKDNFIKDFAAKDDIVASYVNVSLPKNWAIVKNKKRPYGVNRINIADYERTLINFLENSHRISTKHPLLIIIGGAGTGKSSSVKYALAKANICEGCSHYSGCDKKLPQRILIDYLSFKSEVSADSPLQNNRTGIPKKTDNFWWFLIKVLDKIIEGHLDLQTETSDFWRWLVNDCKSFHSLTFYRFLYPKLNLFEHFSENKEELLKLREKLYRTFTSEKLAYYKLCQIAYIKQNIKVNCNILLFDNIDTLDPYLQVKLIDFAIESYRLFGCKAIIPMRPNTFYLNKDASDFIEVIEHWLPSMKEVFEKRLELLKAEKNDAISNAVENILTTIFNRNIMKNVFAAAAGDSIRFGLRNIFNLFLSPVIVTHEDDKPLGEIQLDTNIFFQALFCSETNKEEMYERNFVNLITGSRGPNEKFLSTIKMRMLYYVYRLNQVDMKNLYSHMNSFGYEDIDIIEAINDLLEIRKALLWSSSLTVYNIKTIKKGPNHTIAITPMGISYFEHLLENSLYIRECIVELYSEREVGRLQVLKNTIIMLKNFYDLDYQEIKTYCSENGVSKYKNEYQNENICISIILWKKLLPDILSISKDINYEFDEFNEYFISNKIKNLLKSMEQEMH